MKILSFDVGIKNLAFCCMHDMKIINWDCVEIPTDIKKIIEYLDNLFECMLKFEWETFDLILVEKQPNRNPRMKMIETLLMTYFLMKKVMSVKSYSAKYKLGKTIGKQVKGQDNYRIRKKISIEKCKCFLKQNEMIKDLETINKSKKKDDLSDCFLQILAYIDHEFYKSNQMETYEGEICTKIVSRKPSDKQIKKGYSQSNLKYLINTDTIENLTNNINFIKAVKKFYNGDIHRAIQELKKV